MSFSKNLYFIALIPKRELCEKITAFKQDFASRFNSSKALKVYPHITLKAPFKLSPRSHTKLVNWFADLYILQNKFTIQLKDFGAFANKKSPVVYVNPVVTKELRSLHQQLIASFNSAFPDNVHSTDLEFNPHMTIAYRDLSPEMFQKAWSEYKTKKFDASFEAEAIYLLQHDLKKWNVISTYNLNRDVASF